MRLTEKQLGGWSLLIGTATVAVAYALSPGRGLVDNVSTTSLSNLTMAMARNAELSYAMPIVIICGALLMLHGILTARRFAGPLPRLGILGMALALVLQMVMRGLDYMIVGLGEAAFESEGVRSEEWLQTAVDMQRMVFALHFTSSVAGYVGIAILALGLALRSELVRMPRTLHVIVAILAVVSLVVFISAWHSVSLELAFAPVFAAMSLAGLVYMVLLGWGLVSSQKESAVEDEDHSA